MHPFLPADTTLSRFTWIKLSSSRGPPCNRNIKHDGKHSIVPKLYWELDKSQMSTSLPFTDAVLAEWHSIGLETVVKAQDNSFFIDSSRVACVK